MKANINFIFEKKMPERYSYLENIFKGSENQVYVLVSQEAESYTLLVGLGEEEKVTPETIRNSIAKAIKKAKEIKAYDVTITYQSVQGIDEDMWLIALAEGIELGQYTFDKYKSDRKEEKALVYKIEGIEDAEKVEQIIKERKHLAQGICFARDLINEPANVLYPETLGDFAKEAGEKCGFEVEVLKEQSIKALGMEAMLAVGNGSVHKPRLIIMRHLMGEDDKVYGVVGKGLTCDTGGYSLKSSDSMYYNKSDMSGAANTIGLMMALAQNKVKKNVIAVIPACENVISGESYKIGDVVYTKAGKTIEVLNTDAEGRLALADALTYIIREEKVDCIVDMATLTGVAGATFGNVYSALISNNDTFYNAFMEAAQVTQENFWRLPTHKTYRSWINSDVADIKNTGAAGGGTITAAMFLQEFVEDKPWIHLDIAATACTNPPTHEYEFKGGTGVAIRTLYTLIKGE